LITGFFPSSQANLQREVRSLERLKTRFLILVLGRLRPLQAAGDDLTWVCGRECCEHASDTQLEYQMMNGTARFKK